MSPPEQPEHVTDGSEYPSGLVAEVRTTDGGHLHVRPIRPDDAPGLVEFHEGLSTDSVYRRFFFVHLRLTDSEVERFTRVDYVDRLALVALDGNRLVAVGRYDRRPGTDEAEVAFVVADHYQHRGIGTLLLEQLAAAAWSRGITQFVAETLTDNRDMLRVFFDSGFLVTATSEGGTSTVRFGIEPDDRYLAARAARHAGTAAT